MPREWDENNEEDKAFMELYKDVTSKEGWNRSWANFAYTFWVKGIEYIKEPADK